MKLYRTILLLAALASLIACNKLLPTPSNGGVPPAEWTPTHIRIVTQDQNQVTIQWDQLDDRIDGFRVDKQIDQNAVQEGWQNLEKTVKQFTDNTLATTPGAQITYTVYATAGEYLSLALSITVNTVGPPVLGQMTHSNVGFNSIDLACIVSSDGGAPVTERGFAYQQGQKAGGEIKVPAGSGTGAFNATVTGLLPGTNYAFRAYATNSTGTVYTNATTISTQNVQINFGTVTSANVSGNGVTLSSSLELVGQGSISERGFCLGTAADPTIDDHKYTAGEGPGEFSTTITDLNPGTTYYARAYGILNGMPAYSQGIDFTTQDGQITFGSLTLSDPTSSTISCQSSITATGGLLVTSYGFCYGTSANPTVENNRVGAQGGLSDFANDITGLSPNVTYHVRAFGQNDQGYFYSENQSMSTILINPPDVETRDIYEVDETTYNIYGEILDNGGSEIVESGILYGTSMSLLYGSADQVNATAVSGMYMCQLTNLRQGTEYFVKAFARNAEHVGYGSTKSFTTAQTAELPTLSDVDVLNVTYDEATLSARVTDNGGGNVSACGFVMSRNASPTLQNNEGIYTRSGTNFTYQGTIDFPEQDLEENYFIRAYATNEAGTAYGPTTTTARIFYYDGAHRIQDIYINEFLPNNDLVDIVIEDEGRWAKVINGYMELQGGGNTQTWFFWNDTEVPNEPYDIEMHFNITNGNAGFNWAMNPDHKVYYFMQQKGVSSHWGYLDWSLNPPSYTTWNENTQIDDGTFKLTIRKFKGMFYIFIDEEYVFSHQEDTPSHYGDNFGFIISNGAYARVEYLRMYGLDEDGPVIPRSLKARSAGEGRYKELR